MKLIRFFVVTLFAIVLFCFLLSIIPAISWIFGGSFIYLIHIPEYCGVFGVISAAITGYILNETVDKHFRFIK